MSSLKDWLALTRFEHAIMLAIAVFVGLVVANGSVPPFDSVLALALLVPIFSEMGSFALNDYLDIETDRLNGKKDRPLVTGKIKPESALYFAWFSHCVSVICAAFINTPAFIIALLFNLAAILYNYKLKDIALVGNLYIALTMAIPFIFGNLVVLPFLLPVSLILAAVAFVAGLAREIIKTVQDVEGDKKARNARTLPMVIGETNSILLAIALYVSFIVLALLPFALNYFQKTIPALAFVFGGILCFLAIIYSLLKRADAKSYKRARNLSLLGLFLGLIGYLIAILV